MPATNQPLINLEQDLLRASDRLRANHRQPERDTQNCETHPVMDEKFRSKFAMRFSANPRRLFPS